MDEIISFDAEVNRMARRRSLFFRFKRSYGMEWKKRQGRHTHTRTRIES